MILNKNIFKKIYLSLISFFLICTASAQLTVNGSMTPSQLVQNVLLGSGVTASNITYNGNLISSGSFNGSSSNIGFTSGVLLTCGDLANAVGPNNNGSSSLGNALPGDPDLDLIMSPTTSFDATILEFDFVPTSDTVKFRYVFGSEEYMEFVSSLPGGINDGFGFFISGPGITGPYSNNSENIAIIPGTSLPVTMFNLNLNTNSAYYFDNGDGWGSGTAADGSTIQYDGFTVPLTAISAVQCGQTYHIKIAIGDGGDDVLDSGVFLEAGSFASSGVAIISEISYGGSNDTILYEGCGTACLYFIRAANITSTDTINVGITGTAVNGTDYYEVNAGIGTPLPTQFIFAAGQDSISICFNALLDGNVEGFESIILTIAAQGTGLCIPPSSSVTVYLNEYTPMLLNTSNDTTLCNILAPVTLLANVTGGVQPYTYSWTNGAGAIANPTVNPTTNTTYIVTVNDACNGSPTDPTPAVIDSVTVSISPIPSITALVSYGSANDSTFYEGCGQACIYFVRMINIAQAETYTLTIGGTATNGVDYSPALPTTISFAAGQDSVSYCINGLVDGAGEIMETILLSFNLSGVCALNANAALYISELSPILITSISNDTTLCNMLAPVTLLANVSGGVQPYTYLWTNGAGTTSNPTVNTTSNTTYKVTVNDACNGSPTDPTPAVIDSVTVSFFPIPVITASVIIGAANDSTFYEGCGQACIYFVRMINISEAASYTLTIGGTATNGVDYSPALPTQLNFTAGQDSLSYCINGLVDGAGEAMETILLSINLTGACTLNANAELYISELSPILLTYISNDTILNCTVGPVNLLVNATGGLQPYAYSWSNGIPTNNQTVTPLVSTTYTITVSDACADSPDPTPNNTDSISITLNIPLPLGLTVGNDVTACPEDVVNLNVVTTGGAQPLTYLWTSNGIDTINAAGTANANIIVSAEGLYTINVLDNCGNTQNEQLMVNVAQNCLLNIPNIITPDSKGSLINETFFIENLDEFPGSSLVIYNRFGNKIYGTSNYVNNWSGDKYSDGTYYYVLTVPSSKLGSVKVKPSSGKKSYKGTTIDENEVFAGFFQIVRSK